jgi:hypothetical protein
VFFASKKNDNKKVQLVVKEECIEQYLKRFNEEFC